MTAEVLLGRVQILFFLTFNFQTRYCKSFDVFWCLLMSLYYFNLLITILFLLYLSKGAVSEWLSLPDVPIIFWSCVRCADTLFSGAKVPKSSPKTPARILCGRRNSSFIVSGPETSQTGLDWTLLCHSNSFYIYIYMYYTVPDYCTMYCNCMHYANHFAAMAYSCTFWQFPDTYLTCSSSWYCLGTLAVGMMTSKWLSWVSHVFVWKLPA